MYRKRISTSEDLLASEVTILHHANIAPDGIWGFRLKEYLGDTFKESGATYKALGRLTTRGLLTARNETIEESELHSGPPRKLYFTTEEGGEIMADALAKINLLLEQQDGVAVVN